MKVFGSAANIQPQPNPKPMRVLRGTACVVTIDDKGNAKEGPWSDALVHGVTVYPNELIRWR